jgi:thiamine-phosphate pyrophosphorylase
VSFAALYVMLIVITPPTCVSQEHSIIRTLFDHGLQRLHVRKPGWSNEAIEQYVDRVDPYRDRIVIHSTPQLAARLGVKVTSCDPD